MKNRLAAAVASIALFGTPGAIAAPPTVPSNPPWNQSGSTVQGSTEPDSEVYVPSDPAFGTKDLSEQAPNAVAGKVVDLTYPDPESTSPAGQHCATAARNT